MAKADKKPKGLKQKLDEAYVEMKGKRWDEKSKGKEKPSCKGDCGCGK